jgi:PAS domain S-box-containing protein
VILAYDEAAIKARQIQDAVCEVEDKFRIIADSTPIAVMLYQDDHWIYANRAAETITGYSAKELCSMNFWDFVHPDHKALVRERGQKRQRGEETINRYEFKIITKNGTEKWVDLAGASMLIGIQPAGVVSVADITGHKRAEEEREKLILGLKEAFSKVKALSGLLPICASCKKIRNDKGYWEQVEVYIRDRSEAEFTHGFCPECAERLYPQHYRKK